MKNSYKSDAMSSSWYLSCLFAFLDAFGRQIGVVPATKAVLQIPRALAVANEHDFVDGSVGHGRMLLLLDESSRDAMKYFCGSS